MSAEKTDKEHREDYKHFHERYMLDDEGFILTEDGSSLKPSYRKKSLKSKKRTICKCKK